MARISQALRLREAGLTYERIAQQLGVNLRTAWDDVQIGLEISLYEPADQVRELELRRLDAMWATMYTKAIGGNIEATHAALRIQERRAKMLGIDAPNPDDGTGIVVGLIERILDESDQANGDPSAAETATEASE